MKAPKVHVTDHAVIRYLERVQGVDITAIRTSIALRVDQAACLGAEAVVIDGYRYVFGKDEYGPVLLTVSPRGGNSPIRRSGKRGNRVEIGE